MQTFVAYNNYRQSAKVLDKQRLNKQITETSQILNCLITGGSWENHPAVRMWKGFEPSLCRYGEACQGAFVAVGGSSSHKSWAKIDDLMRSNGWANGEPPMPPWMGREDIHSSHRGRLLHKGNLDTARKRAILLLKGKRGEVDAFVKEFFNSKRKLFLRDLTVEQVAELHKFFDQEGVETYDNWYEQFNWHEKPSNEYVWPVKLLG